jgi:hypothetical protein
VDEHVLGAVGVTADEVDALERNTSTRRPAKPAARLLSALPWTPAELMLIRSVLPLLGSRTNVSLAPLVSRRTRLEA